MSVPTRLFNVWNSLKDQSNITHTYIYIYYYGLLLEPGVSDLRTNYVFGIT